MTVTPADINARGERGQTKIFLAAEAGDAAEVARLLELKGLRAADDLSQVLVASLTIKKTVYNFILFDSTQTHATLYCLRERSRASCSFVAQSWREDRGDQQRWVCLCASWWWRFEIS